ncbi:hypothetical protein HDU87_005083 [Geranomyces variabilis]|uniref:Gated mechanosensitive channel n=1 Tax=Geranomyces variabilis TaxID=109894 RepID=A0AAD5XTE5_9FUNG|nr:hypothetical protein HDU87_005083 [Geranomyces variabilis]
MERSNSKDNSEYHEMSTHADRHDLEAQHDIEGQPAKHYRPRTPAAAARFAGAIADTTTKGLGKGLKSAGSVASDFKAFLNRGNVVDLAVGVVMGAAFTAIVTSIVTDIITPIISLGMQSNMENNYIVLRCPPNLPNATDYATHKYMADCSAEKLQWGTVADAQRVGAVTWNWGKFLSTIINFLIISAIIFFLVKLYTAARRPAPKPITTKPCLFCCKDIPLKASRCPECTSHVEEEEEKVPGPVGTTDSSRSFPFLKVLPNALPFAKGGKKGV